MNLDQLMFMRKFVYAMVVLIVVTIACMYMKYSGDTYRDIIVGVSGMFLVAQAYVDSKKPATPPGGTQ